jgi:hypothetical protein
MPQKFLYCRLPCTLLVISIMALVGCTPRSTPAPVVQPIQGANTATPKSTQPDEPPAEYTSLPVPNSKTQDTILLFAIDESISTSPMPSNCNLADSRYQVPNYFLPLFKQYYMESSVGVNSLSDFSPWIGVMRWPVNHDGIGPTRASDLGSQVSISKSNPYDGAFFDRLFTNLDTLPELPSLKDSNKPSHRDLILFTDGSFQAETADTAVSLQARAQAALKALNDEIKAKGLSFNINVVFLCPQTDMVHADYTWWTNERDTYNWFHIYEADKEQNVTQLLRDLWGNVVSNEFSYSWDGVWQGAYLIGPNGYWNLISAGGEQQDFDKCEDAQGSNNCISFNFPANSTGLVGGVLVSPSNQSGGRLPFIWQDDGITQFPVAENGDGYVRWDDKVMPVSSCTHHEWMFDLGSNYSPTLFWWRASSVELNLTASTQNLLIFYGGNTENQTFPLTVNVGSDPNANSLNNIAKCFDLTLSLGEQEVSRQSLETLFSASSLVGTSASKTWDMKEVLTSIKTFENIANIPPAQAPKVTISIKPARDPVSEILMKNVSLELRYIPMFLSDQYQPCIEEAEFLNGGEEYRCVLPFKFMDSRYYPEVLDEMYIPTIHIYDGKNECGTGFPISSPVVGSKTAIETATPNSNPNPAIFVFKISKTFFDNGFTNCNQPNSINLIIKWDNWDSTYSPLPIAQECPLIANGTTCQVWRNP